MQQLTILGNLGADAVVRDAGSNKAINFRVAVNESYTDKQGTEHEKTNWYDCTIFRTPEQKLTIAQYLTQGRQVLVQGTPKARAYMDKDNAAHASLDVRVEKIKLLAAPKAAEATQATANTATPPAPATDDDNDLPF